MRLNELLEGIPLEPWKNQGPDPVVADLSCDTRTAGPGTVLVITAPRFTEAMGQHLAHAQSCAMILRPEAAKALPLDPPETCPVFLHPDPHRILHRMAARLWPEHPEKVVVVTGTNGKSSTVRFVRILLHESGVVSGSIGTMGVHVNSDTVIPRSTLTLPNSIDLRKIMRALVQDHGVRALALEGSSQGLAQYRLDSVPLEAAAFTQLTQDHLDWHGSMENYFASKARLFGELLPAGKTAVLNLDCPWSRRLVPLCQQKGHRILTYGRAPAADLHCMEARWDGQAWQVRFRLLGQEVNTALPLPGEFQIMNTLAAVGLALGCGVDRAAIVRALPRLTAPEGRLSPAGRTSRGGHVYVDYAHTPDGLASVLKALRPLCSGKLAVVFGCGGDRDPLKRPLMGKIAATLADRVYVTDDNPRTEDPAAIRSAIMAGCPEAAGITEGRAAAIRCAIQESGPGDVVLVAGKGHERVQIVGTQHLPFSDAEEVTRALDEERHPA